MCDLFSLALLSASNLFCRRDGQTERRQKQRAVERRGSQAVKAPPPQKLSSVVKKIK